MTTNISTSYPFTISHLIKPKFDILTRTKSPTQLIIKHTQTTLPKPPNPDQPNSFPRRPPARQKNASLPAVAHTSPHQVLVEPAAQPRRIRRPPKTAPVPRIPPRFYSYARRIHSALMNNIPRARTSPDKTRPPLVMPPPSRRPSAGGGAR